MSFPLKDDYWLQVRDFLLAHTQPLDAILAPNEFMEFFAGNYHYNVTYRLPPSHFEYVVFHKAMLAEIESPIGLEVLRTFQPIFANPVFVVLAKSLPEGLPPVEKLHLQPLLNYFSAIQSQQKKLVKQPRYAVTMTTYNRPNCLRRSLPQILKLGAPVVIVDDASRPENAAENQRIADAYQVTLIRIPQNRGLPNAMNVGIGYWLADLEIDWISYFQDDVDVHPDLFRILAAIQDPVERPLLTGRDAAEHPTFATSNLAGHNVLFKRSMPGPHLHAHRDYWTGVMPIPSPYLGAPKLDGGKSGQGADEDWWITAWSPQSIAKQGKYGVCVPGLVRCFQLIEEGSTWISPSDQRENGQIVVEPPLKNLAISTTRVERETLQ
ncbi:MAG: glycosyltransferase [Chroococcus sp. CMT-3BRIN-NPC107]|jgi:hypothetical protein|nr:glycosyltransferase [Chroococcus sp. CMT-3BRIN-NPC107]